METQHDCFTRYGFAGKAIDFCPVIDAHGNLGPDAVFTVPDLSFESVIRMLDRIGINLLCTCSNPGLYGNVRQGNEIVIQAIRQYPDRFFGYMIPDENFPDSIFSECEAYLKQGFRGIKLWGGPTLPARCYDHPNYKPIYEFANANHLPVLLHTWGVELDSLEPFFTRYQQINFLLAHAGAEQKEKYIRFAQTYANVYLETCYSRAPRGLIEEFIAADLVDKTIWGSDAIYMGAEQQIGRVFFAHISAEDKKKLLGLNAINALHLEI